MDERKIRARLEAERQRLLGVRRDLLSNPETSADLASVGELSDYDQHPADIATEVFEHEKNVSILEQVDAQVREVDEAFERLERGTFGICAACGEPIGDARLEERPFARFCLKDQQRRERGAGLPGTTA
jgi:RNA polymerase-binding transcription factor DksA